MASETGVGEASLLERLISSRNRIILGLSPRVDSTDPDQETPDTPTPRESRGRIILINPLTQGTVVIEGSSSSLDSLLRDLLSKDGQPPASKTSIEAMASVDLGGEDEDGDCVICLEKLVIGGWAKEMPCKHRFHGECIEKWLGIHGSCPVCRYNMPVDDGDERERRRREIWVSFSFNRYRSVESNHTTPPRPDHAIMEG